jgi:hypothetical protein
MGKTPRKGFPKTAHNAAPAAAEAAGPSNSPTPWTKRVVERPSGPINPQDGSKTTHPAMTRH